MPWPEGDFFFGNKTANPVPQDLLDSITTNNDIFTIAKVGYMIYHDLEFCLEMIMQGFPAIANS